MDCESTWRGGMFGLVAMLTLLFYRRRGCVVEWWLYVDKATGRGARVARRLGMKDATLHESVGFAQMCGSWYIYKRLRPHGTGWASLTRGTVLTQPYQDEGGLVRSNRSPCPARQLQPPPTQQPGPIVRSSSAPSPTTTPSPSATLLTQFNMPPKSGSRLLSQAEAG